MGKWRFLWENHGKMEVFMGKPWENGGFYGKTMGKWRFLWENHGKMEVFMGKSWENHKIMGKSTINGSFNGKITGKSWENPLKWRSQSKKNANTIGKP